MTKKVLLLLTAILSSQLMLFAEVKLPTVLSDHMVLQQQSKVRLWGSANTTTLVRITTSWNKKEYKIKTDNDGHFELKINTPVAGGPYSIKFNDGKELVLRDILIGEVWVCSGQSNMTMPMHGFTNQPILNSAKIVAESKNAQIRFFKVQRAASLTPLATVKGEWELATPETTLTFSAIAYQYGKALQEQLHVPVGLILTAVAGTKIQAWMSKESLKSYPEVSIPASLDTIKEPFKEPSTLYNAMVAPLTKFAIKGAIWCQGEANREDYKSYHTLFSTMVATWRISWNRGSFPFYYVQTAPLNSRDKKPTIVLIREAQLKALNTIPNSGMVSTIDVGMEKVIHYTDKTTPAARLATLALDRTYHLNGIAYVAPIYKSMKMERDKIILSFNHTGGELKLANNELNLFEIAGEDRIFYPAIARITKQDEIEVKSPMVNKPAAVRYAFKNWVKGELFNKFGLPVSSFRTDNWELIH